MKYPNRGAKGSGAFWRGGIKMTKTGISGPYEVIIGAVNKIAGETCLLMQGYGISRRALGKNTAQIRELIDGKVKDCFVSYGVEDGKLLWLWVSRVVPDDFDGKLINVRPFIIDQAMIEDGVIEKLAEKSREFHKAGKLRVQVGLVGSEKGKRGLYEKHGAKLAYHLLCGKVSDSLKYLSGRKPKLPDGYSLKAIDMEKDLAEYLHVQILALKSDKTCSMYSLSPARIRKVFLKFFNGKPESKSFGVYYAGKITGSCTVSISKRPRRTGLLASMVVIPGHRGKGLSSVLYSAALSWLKSRKVERYAGISSTERVLANVDKMGRKIVVSYLKI